MGTGHKPAKEPTRSPKSTLDSKDEMLMEKLLAACLALPKGSIDSAMEKTCEDHPLLATQLRLRYDNLLRGGFLEDHEGDDLQGEAPA
jgi:hypothetical protein